MGDPTPSIEEIVANKMITLVKVGFVLFVFLIGVGIFVFIQKVWF